MGSTLYEVLGAAPGASSEELKRAYRRAVRAAHPDTGGSTVAFQTVQDAWAVLGDPVRRKAYDVRTSSNGATQSQHSPAAGTGRPEERVARPAPSSSHTTTSSDEPAPAAAAAAPDSSTSPPRAESADVEETAGPRTVPWRTITVGLVLAAAATSGVLGGLIVYSMFGRGGAIVAGLYLLAAGVAVWEQRLGSGELEQLRRGTAKACWLVVALWAALAVIAWAGARPWVPLALYAAVFGVFGGAMWWLGRTPWTRDPGRAETGPHVSSRS